MQKFLFFISIVSLCSIVQAFEDNQSDIQIQEVLSVDIGKLMGAWKCHKCFWLNSRNQSKCDKCGYHNKEIEEEINRRKEQNWKETLEEIFLMLKNNDEAVDLFNGRIYINPKKLAYKEGKYYIQDDNMNYVLIDKISEDIYGYYIYVEDLEKIRSEGLYTIELLDNDINFEMILCGYRGEAKASFEKNKKGTSVNLNSAAEYYTENEKGINHSIGVRGNTYMQNNNDSTKQLNVKGKAEYSLHTEKDNTYSIAISGAKSIDNKGNSCSETHLELRTDY